MNDFRLFSDIVAAKMTVLPKILLLGILACSAVADYAMEGEEVNFNACSTHESRCVFF